MQLLQGQMIRLLDHMMFPSFQCVAHVYLEKFKDTKGVTRSSKSNDRQSQWPNDKGKLGQKMIYKTLHSNLSCPWRVSSYCFTNDAHRVTVYRRDYYMIWKSCWALVCVNKYIININDTWNPYKTFQTNRTSFYAEIVAYITTLN
jgi:hypothetical protein